MLNLPEPHTTKRKSANRQGPTGDPSSCGFYKYNNYYIPL